MEKISINKNGFGFFKVSDKKAEAATSKSMSTNPFGISFKGNVIQADVFESSTPKTNPIAEKGKMFASAVVGGINSFNDAFKRRAADVVAFGRSIKTNVMNTLEWANNYDAGAALKKSFGAIRDSYDYRIGKLTNTPVDNLREMWQAELAV